jgi:hypothetical protein
VIPKPIRPDVEVPRLEVIHSGVPQYVGGEPTDDDDGGWCLHTYSAQCVRAVAGDLAKLGFIGAERYCECHEVVDVALAVAEVKAAGDRLRSPAGMVRYLVAEWARERKKRIAAGR